MDMFKKALILPLIILLGYALFASDEIKMIASGIAIFIVGMMSMEEGFKLFSGGVLERILQKTTNTLPKAVFSGFVSTAVVQSSSLVSVIAISFLSAELVSLYQAIGIIFGSNIGTTATAWIVAAFGLKIKISHYAMPMLVFGVMFSFFTDRTYKGLGNILLGLGFIFLGIGYMKEGFETLKNAIDLGQFAIDGYPGIAVYIMVGAVATVIIQSSSATMALIITAVATGQIDYINSLSLAIGANIGTTVTAVIGSLKSNANGKRLAVAHLIFNMATALFAIVFIYILKDMVEFISRIAGIGDDDIAMKLSLFHTIFNVAGVLIVAPFTGKLVGFLENLFSYKGERRGRPRYLDEQVIKSPKPAIEGIRKEVEHLYDSVSFVLIQALKLNHTDVWSDLEMKEVLKTVRSDQVNIDEVYETRIKNLYSEIIRFSILAEKHMDKNERKKVYDLKLASRHIVEVIKEIRELQKNISAYMKDDNEAIKGEYNFLRGEIAQILRHIQNLRDDPEDINNISRIESDKEETRSFDIIEMKRLSILLRDEKISNRMATSLMNDGAYTSKIASDLIESAKILWIL